MNYEQKGTGIDVPRLLDDLHVTETDLRNIAALDIPQNIGVNSTGDIKVSTTRNTLLIPFPDRRFNVIGVDAESGIAEQPVGQETFDGAHNRLIDGTTRLNPFGVEPAAWFTIENGLFKRTPQVISKNPLDQTTEEVDLATVFDPEAEYEDRAVISILLPGHPVITRVSPSAEAVLFPQEAVLAAYESDGGFAVNTVGSALIKMGIVKNGKNPHSELTADRRGGPLNRQDQIARGMMRALFDLASTQRS